MLLHMSGLAQQWADQGKDWVCFFQDTNGLVFKSMLAVLGVSRELDLDLNSMCIPRQAKQEIGAVTKLVYADGRAVTCNTEYNQLGPLLVVRSVARALASLAAPSELLFSFLFFLLLPRGKFEWSRLEGKALWLFLPLTLYLSLSIGSSQAFL